MTRVEQMPMSISSLKARYNRGETNPRELIFSLLQTARNSNSNNPIWIYLLTDQEIESYLAKLENENAKQLPLYGIPFAIKDNIDLAGVPTTASCPEFSYVPEHSAYVVDLLIAAGAVPIGKTNLDQFATGLVGTRSPYGACKNALNPEYISGGSSSGSAVALAENHVAFSLGTDTAGSGRVPAALNNLVGLKPSRGILSNRGLVPACRSLDCISIFAHTLEDANSVLDVVAQFDGEDPYARVNPYSNGMRYTVRVADECVIGIPRSDQLAFFGDSESEALFSAAVDAARNSGAKVVEVDFQPFLQAAKLLYEGPWVAERYIATSPIIEQNPSALLPVTRAIIEKGKLPLAIDAFKSNYSLQACRQKAESVLASVDCIMTPTIGTEYKISEIEADPIQLNSNLGYYTNFMNLLDCAALAIPSGFKSSGVGFGVTLFHRAFSDKRLLSYAYKLAQEFKLGIENVSTSSAKASATNYVDIVVCGAHLDGLTLNWQLCERGGRLVEATTTSPNYRFYALAGGPLPRPGLVRDEENGQAIQVEVWRLPIENFGSFVAEIPRPLGIGKVELAGGRWCVGFICEPYGLVGAKDITELGGWRAYVDAPAHQI